VTARAPRSNTSLGCYEDRIIPAAEMPSRPPPPYSEHYVLELPDGDFVQLPLLPLPDGQHAIVSLCITENSFELEDRLSSAMAELARPLRPDIIVGVPTLGMVFAASVAKKLGHRHYVPLSYSRKFWFDDTLSVAVNSITTPSQPKQVFIDPRIVDRLRGRRTVLVEDVISTGTTIAAQLTLMSKLQAKVVGIVTAMQETCAWIERLGSINPRYPKLVRSCIRCPLFRRVRGGWAPDWTTLPPGKKFTRKHLSGAT
jgi:adenine/guanine phosphoribosyltransferase-like PRPP-binding protein